jgi:hypothetical protein
VRRDKAVAELRAFIAAYLEDGDDVDRMIGTIEHSIRKFAENKSNPDVREQAKELAESAGKFRKAVEESEFVWPWLLAGKLGPRTRSEVLTEVEKVEKASFNVARRLKNGKKPPDLLRSALAYELAEYFKAVTGSKATPSSSANFEDNKPGTKFGHFVHLALASSSYASTSKVKTLITSPSTFIKDAAASGKRRAVPLSPNEEISRLANTLGLPAPPANFLRVPRAE